MGQIAMTADLLREMGFSPEVVQYAEAHEATNPGGPVPTLVYGAPEPLDMPKWSEVIERQVRALFEGVEFDE